MVERLKAVKLEKKEFEQLIKNTKIELMNDTSKEKLLKLLIVINKPDFLSNFGLKEEEYMWLDKTLDVTKIRDRIIFSDPKRASTKYFLRQLSKQNGSQKNSVSFYDQKMPESERGSFIQRKDQNNRQSGASFTSNLSHIGNKKMINKDFIQISQDTSFDLTKKLQIKQQLNKENTNSRKQNEKTTFIQRYSNNRVIEDTKNHSKGQKYQEEKSLRQILQKFSRVRQNNSFKGTDNINQQNLELRKQKYQREIAVGGIKSFIHQPYNPRSNFNPKQPTNIPQINRPKSPLNETRKASKVYNTSKSRITRTMSYSPQPLIKKTSQNPEKLSNTNNRTIRRGVSSNNYVKSNRVQQNKVYRPSFNEKLVSSKEQSTLNDPIMFKTIDNIHQNGNKSSRSFHSSKSNPKILNKKPSSFIYQRTKSPLHQGFTPNSRNTSSQKILNKKKDGNEGQLKGKIGGRGQEPLFNTENIFRDVQIQDKMIHKIEKQKQFSRNTDTIKLTKNRSRNLNQAPRGLIQTKSSNHFYDNQENDRNTSNTQRIESRIKSIKNKPKRQPFSSRGKPNTHSMINKAREMLRNHNQGKLQKSQISKSSRLKFKNLESRGVQKQQIGEKIDLFQG